MLNYNFQYRIRDDTFMYLAANRLFENHDLYDQLLHAFCLIPLHRGIYNRKSLLFL